MPGGRTDRRLPQVGAAKRQVLVKQSQKAQIASTLPLKDMLEPGYPTNIVDGRSMYAVTTIYELHLGEWKNRRLRFSQMTGFEAAICCAPVPQEATSGAQKREQKLLPPWPQSGDRRQFAGRVKVGM